MDFTVKFTSTESCDESHLLRAGYISSRFFRAVNLPGAVGIIATPRKKDPFECTVLYQRSVSRIFSAKSIKTDPKVESGQRCEK